LTTAAFAIFTLGIISGYTARAFSEPSQLLHSKSIEKADNQELLSSDERSFVRKYLASLEFGFVQRVVRPWTMVNDKRVKFVYDWVINLDARRIEGDIVECGVWKGGATMAMMIAALKGTGELRNFWLFDTFQGLPAPGEEDDDRAKQAWKDIQSGKDKRRTRARTVEDGKWNYGAKALVKNNVYSTQYPPEKIHFIEGKVEETLFSTTLPTKIALLRLDTDWYASTKAELDVLYDRLVPGGLLFIDDYCSWGGSRKATDEFFNQRGLAQLLKKYTRKRECKSKFDLCLYIVKPK